MIDEIFKELAILGDNEDATSKHVLLWVQSKTTKGAKVALNDIKEANDFDVVRQNIQKQDHAVLKCTKQKTDASTVAQNISQQYPAMARSVAGVGNKTTLKQYENQCGSNSNTGMGGRWSMMLARR